MAEINDVFQVRIVSFLGVQFAYNVLHYEVVTKGGDGAPLSEIAAAMSSVLLPSYFPLLVSTATVKGVDVQKIWPLPISVLHPYPDDGGLGTAEGDALPKQTCGVVTKRTLKAGPHYRGRVYIPFPAETDNTSAGVPTAGYLTKLDDWAQVADDTVLAEDGADTNALLPVIYNRLTHETTVIDRCVRRTKWGTQRRRGDFGAANLDPW